MFQKLIASLNETCINRIMQDHFQSGWHYRGNDVYSSLPYWDITTQCVVIQTGSVFSAFTSVN
jgi:hypothetical protein